MNRREFLASTAVLPWSISSLAATSSESVVAALEAAIREKTIPGAAIVASLKGKVRLDQVRGTYCSLKEREVQLAAQTLHPLYSFSKLITGTVVAMTIQEGRLEYGDPVSRHIPEFTGGNRERVTLRHCLTHAAGLTKPESKAVDEEASWNAAVQLLCQAPLEWEPGSKTSYHGWSGAFLAAECVRRVSGRKPWVELCQEKLFAPLGLKSLSFVLPSDDQPLALVPQPNPDKPLPKSHRAACGYAGHPGAGCVGTLAEALKVLQLHLQEGVWNGKPLIAKEVFRQMHTVQYAREIEAARAAGKSPAHEPWGLGPLLRGEGPSVGGHKWFGFANQTSAGIFGHAGIDTLIGVADPRSQKALVFASTHSPKPANQTVPLRNKVTDLTFAELG
jgi:CubicO group peptidase (beta-lactamase class C family)